MQAEFATGRLPRRVISTGASPLVRTKSEKGTPLDVVFSVDNVNDFNGDSFVWDFGDGEPVGLGRRVTHSYAEGGAYDVRLAYHNLDGTEGDFEWPLSINDPPTAVIEDWGVLQGSGGLGIWLSGSGVDNETESDSLEYFWTFGDGNTDTGSRVNHVFEAGGLYQVKLRVRDPERAVARTSLEIELASDTIVVPEEDDDIVEEVADLGPGSVPEPVPESVPEPVPESVPESNPESLSEPTPVPQPETQPEPHSVPDEDDAFAVVPEVPEVPEAPEVSDPVFEEPPVSELPEDEEVLMLFDFETPLDWVDGTVLQQGVDPLHVYEGNGALEFRPGLEASVELVGALTGLMEPFFDAPEVYASWYSLANVSSVLDAAVVRNILETRSLTALEQATLQELVAQLESLPTAVSLQANTWYCVEVSALLAEGGSAVMVTVDGQTLLSSFLPGVLPTSAIGTFLPLVLEAPGLGAEATCWLDLVGLATQPTVGCE